MIWFLTFKASKLMLEQNLMSEVKNRKFCKNISFEMQINTGKILELLKKILKISCCNLRCCIKNS